MRTPIEALKEIRDRLTYFCLRTDGKYDPPWATELVGIIDDILRDAGRRRGMSDNEKTPVFTYAFLNIVSNESACRKALGEISEMLSSHTFQTIGAEDAFIIGKCHRAAEDALKTPPRNCDVGTEEEQFERWWAFCDRFDEDCTGCPYGNCHHTMAYCFAKYAQMPYEAEKGAWK